MGLEDRFRIDELVKKGSAAIRRDATGGILVQKSDGMQIKPTKPVSDKPFGEAPIKSKQVSQRFKHELPAIEETDINPNQQSFSGETSGYLEKPVYDVEELKKAVDIKVDELIKPKKLAKGEFVPKPRYDRLQERYDAAQVQIKDLSAEVARLESIIQSQVSEINSLQSQLESATAQLVNKQKELDALLNRYNELLADFQNAIIRGTKEGIERVSLAAQVKGLQAQKETLQAQIKAQQDIVKSLQQQAQIQQQQVEIQQQVQEQQLQAKEKEIEQAKQTNLLDIVGDRPQFEVKGKIAWAAAPANKNEKPDFALYYDDRKKDPKRWLSGNKFDFFNISDESVTLTVTDEVTQKGKWLSGVPSSITIPASPDGGSTPGQKTLTFNRGNAGKGTWETTLKFKNPSTGEELKMKTHYWQARNKRDT